MSAPIRVLFVCTANTCRSPFMETYVRSVVPEAVTVASAGTQAREGRPMSPEMVAELTARGLVAGGFRSRLLTGTMLEETDLVLTAESSHLKAILDAHPHAARKVHTLDKLAGGGDVTDPYGRGPAVSAATAHQITDMLDRLLPVLGAPSRPGQKALTWMT